jgi:hypothetical protein
MLFGSKTEASGDVRRAEMITAQGIWWRALGASFAIVRDCARLWEHLLQKAKYSSSPSIGCVCIAAACVGHVVG